VTGKKKKKVKDKKRNKNRQVSQPCVGLSVKLLIILSVLLPYFPVSLFSKSDNW